MPAVSARAIRWVLTDIDDTMTRDGKLIPSAYSALCDLASAGLKVVAVTGRSAGWAQVHMQEWPLFAAIAENGAISYARGEGGAVREIAFPGAVRNTAASFARAARRSFQAVPRALPAPDNNLRLYDYAIDYAESVRPPLSAEEVSTIVDIFAEEGCSAKPSSIHVNCWVGPFDKKSSAIELLSAIDGYDDSRDRDSVLYVGDAPNDEVMFEHFPNSCAVANVAKWLGLMSHAPAWVSSRPFGDGFAEIARTVLAARV